MFDQFIAKLVADSVAAESEQQGGQSIYDIIGGWFEGGQGGSVASGPSDDLRKLHGVSDLEADYARNSGGDSKAMLKQLVDEVAPTLDANYFQADGDTITSSYAAPGTLKKGFSRTNKSIGEEANKKQRLASALETRKLKDIMEGEDTFREQIKALNLPDEIKKLLLVAKGDARKAQGILDLEDNSFQKKLDNMGKTERRLLLEFISKRMGGNTDIERDTHMGDIVLNSMFAGTPAILNKLGRSTGLWGVDQSDIAPDMRSRLEEAGISSNFIDMLFSEADRLESTDLRDILERTKRF